MRPCRVHLCCLSLSFLAGMGCGPQAGGGDGETTDDPSPTPDMGDSGSETSGDTSTGDPAACGDGVIDQGEWCHERVVIENEYTERMLRIMPGFDEAGAFVLWSGLHLVSVKAEDAGVAFHSYYEGPAGNYRPNGRVFPAQIAPTEHGRVDYIYWSPEIPTMGSVCLSANVFPGPERTHEGRALPIRELDCDRDGVLIPVSLGEGPDAFFAVDEATGLAAFYEPVDLGEWSPFDIGVHVATASTVDTIPLCQAYLAAAGNAMDLVEDVFVLGQNCADGGNSILTTYRPSPSGMVIAEKELDVTAPANIEAMELVDIDGDLLDDIVLAGEGVVEFYLQESDGTFAKQEVPGVDVVGFVPRETASPPPMEPIVRIQTGEFDASPGLEVVVPVLDGISILSSSGVVVRSETFEEPILGFAATDINGDSLADIAVLHPDKITFLLSRV